ncbi:MAG: lysylphosphatidylglycerol synthase domain-containing protein, partial [Bacteroidales bacterium]
AILYVNKEGFSLGRSSAIVLATSFLDELYFIFMLPMLLLTVDLHKLFAVGNDLSSIASNSFFYMAIIGFVMKIIFAAFVGYGLFVNPRGLKWLLLQIFRLPFIRRWRHYVNDAGTEIIYSSKAFKQKPFGFWFKAFCATFISWTARYWVVNALLVAFFTIRGFADHFLIFARQLIMWIMQLVSPTPGGSGFSEYIFSKYLSDFIPASPEYVAPIIMGLALLWRMISYYPYLVVGAIILPRWIRTHFGSSR